MAEVADRVMLTNATQDTWLTQIKETKWEKVTHAAAMENRRRELSTMEVGARRSGQHGRLYMAAKHDFLRSRERDFRSLRRPL